MMKIKQNWYTKRTFTDLYSGCANARINILKGSEYMDNILYMFALVKVSPKRIKVLK